MAIKDSLPDNIIIIGAGVFGLSTALAISNRFPSSTVTIVDRLTPPVEDGSSVDTTRCIRADYADPVYAKLAKTAQDMLQDDPDLSKFMFQQGMTFASDGAPSRFTELWKTQEKAAKSAHDAADIVDMVDRAAVFRRIHGDTADPAPTSSLLDGKSRWNVAYCNLQDAFIDARACIQVFYERCLQRPSINFQCGSAVDRICVENGVATGVLLENGTTLHAGLVLVAAGAWSSRLVDLGRRINPIAIEVAWIKVTPEEEKRWKNMSITTNLSTGFNMFPPYNGEIKILRRSTGYKNTIQVENPEDRSKMMQISYPRTKVSNPGDSIPLEAETSLRNDLREIMPSLCERPFADTKLCWVCATPTADFLVAPHPRIAGIHMATGGAAHAWKFLPIIGDLVVDSIEGKLSEELTKKWAFSKGSEGSDYNAPRMDGEPKELHDVIRS